jgi:hypothetical protein
LDPIFYRTLFYDCSPSDLPECLLLQPLIAGRQHVLIGGRSGQTMVGSSITGGHVASSSNQKMDTVAK